MYSFRGFQYCDLLLSGVEQEAGKAKDGSQKPGDRSQNGEDRNQKTELLNVCRVVGERVAGTIKIAERNNWLLDIALDHLTLGRATLYAFVLDPSAGQDRESAGEHLRAAVSGLRGAGQQQYLPPGLLSRAWLRAITGSRIGPESAQADLDEAKEIAERGPMPLFMADIHLYRARLFFRDAQYPWESPRKDLAQARRLIEKHGYGRRMPELVDAENAIKHGI